MARLVIAFGIVCFMAFVAHAAKPLVDPTKCQNGCKGDEDCPQNAACNPLNGGNGNSNCGFCVCQDGFKAQGNKCNPIKGYSTTTTATSTTTASTTTAAPTTTQAETTTTTTTTAAPTTTTTTATTTTGTTPQPATPPAPEPLNCGDYDCSTPGASVTSDDSDPMKVRSAKVDTSAQNSGCKRQLVIPPRKCNIIGVNGAPCFGSYCLTESSGNDYCICPYYKRDRQCAVDKPGQCAQATGEAPAGLLKLQNTRLRANSTSREDQEYRGVYGRHFAASVNDCIKLCQWAKGECKAVNYGPIAGVNVCELLSALATKTNLLSGWLKSANGWQYVQLAQSN